MTCTKKGTTNTLSIHQSTITINMKSSKRTLIHMIIMIILYSTFVFTVTE